MTLSRLLRRVLLFSIALAMVFIDTDRWRWW